MRKLWGHCMALLVAMGGASTACGGVINGAFATDSFPSSMNLSVTLLQAYTGAGVDIDVCIFGTGPTNAARELNAFSGFFGTDTIDVELTSVNVGGSVVAQSGGPPLVGLPVQLRIGNNNGFFAGLQSSTGQVAEYAGPQNGLLDVFPANSFFDVFVEAWADINGDTIVDPGEVLRNFDYALRMQNTSLTSLPPTAGNAYTSIGRVQANDPLLGDFGAFVDFGLIDLYVVNPDGTNSGTVAARLNPLGGPWGPHVHTVTPEPSSFAVLGVGALAIVYRLRRKRLRSNSSSLPVTSGDVWRALERSERLSECRRVYNSVVCP